MRRCTLGLVLVLLAGACGGGSQDVALERAHVEHPVSSAIASRAPVTTATPATTTTTTTPDTTTTAPATTTTAPPPPPPPPSRQPWATSTYEGFGAWLDAYDWSAQFTRSGNVVGLGEIDHMAAEGVQTLYIQASRWNSPTDVLEPERLLPIIERAHQHGMLVVAWYLPTLEDLGVDLRRMLAVAGLGVDGFAVDIEARNVADVGERNRRLVALSQQLRANLPGKAIGAIVLEPVLLEDVNPNYWPSFPWAEIAPYYDVWMPMSYWTNRRGAWRAAHDYTAQNMSRIRERIGNPNALLHPIGGIGDKTTVPDLQQMLTAAIEQHAMGGSIYDYRTSRPEFWATLRGFRAP